MSSQLNDIVDVQITREDTPISRTGFGTPLVLGTNKIFTERVRTYYDLDSLITDGFKNTDPEYLAAEKFFSQSPRVEQVDVGRRDADLVTVSVDTVADNTDYTIKINTSTFTFNSGVGATTITIAAGLVLAINGGTESVTATDLLDGTYTLNADVSGTAYTVILDSNQSMAFVPSDTIINDIVAIRLVKDDWYAVIETRHDVTEVVELANYIEATEKLFFTTSSDTTIIDVPASSDTTSLAYLIKEGDFARTIVCYHEKPTEFEAAFVGKGLPTDPGSITWAFKTLNGIDPSSLNRSQTQNAFDKNCNIYDAVAGVNITRNGTVGSGEYIDIMRGIDWLTARIKENVFGAFIDADKIPYTNDGIRTIESYLRTTLRDAVAENFLSNFTTYAPVLENINPNDKANRVLKGITFKATLTNAIQKVEIRGEVSVF